MTNHQTLTARLDSIVQPIADGITQRGRFGEGIYVRCRVRVRSSETDDLYVSVSGDDTALLNVTTNTATARAIVAVIAQPDPLRDAAPDMLAALKRLEDEALLQSLFDLDSSREDGEEPIAAKAVEQARAAIAHAEGR